MSQAEKTKENLEMVDCEGLAGQKVYFRVRRKNTKLENQIESYETANISLFLTFKNLYHVTWHKLAINRWVGGLLNTEKADSMVQGSLFWEDTKVEGMANKRSQ